MNSETNQDNPYYYPGGIPLGPQARRFGYQFPVYVSKIVWSQQCIWTGSAPRLVETNTDKRIFELLQYAYEGMTKKLAVQDDFVSYAFKAWYWDRTRKNSKKKRRIKLGARLFLHPEDSTPWLFIFNPEKDGLNDLEEGTKPNDE